MVTKFRLVRDVSVASLAPEYIRKGQNSSVDLKTKFLNSLNLGEKRNR